MDNQEEIKLKSIEIGHNIGFNYNPLVSIKVNLSNGESSSLFSAKKSGYEVSNTKIKIRADSKIKKYEFANVGNYIHGMRFLDSEPNSANEWNYYGYGWKGKQ